MFPALRAAIGGLLAGGVFPGIWDCGARGTEGAPQEAGDAGRPGPRWWLWDRGGAPEGLQ